MGHRRAETPVMGKGRIGRGRGRKDGPQAGLTLTKGRERDWLGERWLWAGEEELEQEMPLR